jgi:N4-(beta-N-acetylglucosaminyl)-L-asparaginase
VKAKELQVGYIAVNTKGEFGAYALQKGFTYAVQNKTGSKVFNAKSFY